MTMQHSLQHFSKPYFSSGDRRRAEVRDLAQTNGRVPLNGIDYLEVASDQKTLVVHFLHPLTPSFLTIENLIIEGGTRIPTILVESVSLFDQILLLRVETVGDFSQYYLRLVTSANDLNPPLGIDPQLAQVSFSFWIEATSEFDCAKSEPADIQPVPPPAIDYLAKDYASFRRLMLDRLAVTMPQWQERSPADLGITLVELLAYAADHLSYYQDAVATEAYLGTARKRVSIRRHARLLDYLMNDGCNARVWVVFTVTATVKLMGASQTHRRPGAQLLTQTEVASTVLPANKLDLALNAGAQVFETLEDATLEPACNAISFYTWSEQQYRLPRGATQATLLDSPDQPLARILKPGKVLLFEEVRGATTGDLADADPSRRHAVRLTQVQPGVDPLNGTPIVQIGWAEADALPFELTLASLDAEERPIANVALARGNVVLADAGRTVAEENLSPDWPRPRLQQGPLTQQGYIRGVQDQWVLFDAKVAASRAMTWELRNTQPAISLWEAKRPDLRWQVQRDLLNSDRFARDFVVETEDDGRALLRFGDDRLGRRPNDHLVARYRVGNGSRGNVGPGAITTLVLPAVPESDPEADQDTRTPTFPANAILSIRNPLPAQGGTDPEPIDRVRRDAPQAFRQQQRAVTEQDYAEAAQRYPGVQQALATRRWTGSWYTFFVTVDRAGGLPLDEQFKQGLRQFLEEFRLAGHDLELESPRRVPLDIALVVQVAAGYFRSEVQQALLEHLGTGVLPGGQLAFFHPDRFTFGHAVYLSQIVAVVMQTAGVQDVAVSRFQRWGQPADRELETGLIRCQRLEIPLLDNRPDRPESGRLMLTLTGGL